MNSLSPLCDLPTRSAAYGPPTGPVDVDRTPRTPRTLHATPEGSNNGTSGGTLGVAGTAHAHRRTPGEPHGDDGQYVATVDDDAAQADLFQTNPEAISNLRAEVTSGKLALPQFQRDFIWPPANTASLISSILAKYPAGSLLMWRPGTAQLAPRAVEDAPPLPEHSSPERLILDGQQRVTSLYRALGGKTEETYFISLKELLTDDFELRHVDEIAWDKVVKAQELSAAERRAWKPKDPKKTPPKAPQHHAPEWQHDRWLYPLGAKFDDWMDGIVELGATPADQKKRKQALRLVRDQYLGQLSNYRFPVITLTDAASLAAVCNVFEKLNSNSIRLGPFEILTAKFFHKNVDLRALWEQALQEHPVLRDPEVENDHNGFSIDPYVVLQVITLVEHDSPQRKAVLQKLSANDVKVRWEGVVLALSQVIKTLRDDCGIIHRDILPYQAILTPITGAWLYRDTLPSAKKAQALDKIKQYFWASVFTTNFDQGGASQGEKDYKDLVAWLASKTDNKGLPILPEAVSTLRIKSDDLLSATVKKKALLQGLMALTALSGARDFHKGEPLTPSTYVEYSVNSHHLFPKARLTDTKPKTRIDPDGLSSELILNRALIDARTNQSIGSKKPSAYMQDMEDSGAQVDLLLGSHLAAADIARSDDYRSFIEDRLRRVVAKIEEVTGRSVDPLTPPEPPVAGSGAATPSASAAST